MNFRVSHNFKAVAVLLAILAGCAAKPKPVEQPSIADNGLNKEASALQENHRTARQSFNDVLKALGQ